MSEDPKPQSFSMGIPFSKELEDDFILMVMEMMRETSEYAAQRMKDMIELSHEEYMKKYPPPPEPERCPECGHIIDDYDEDW